MTQLQQDTESYLSENGAIISIAPEGNQWCQYPSGRPINSKGMTVMIQFNGRTAVGQNFDSAIISLKKAGKIDLFQFGYDNCPKCSGSGNMGSNIDGGICYKCSGTGILKRK